MSAWLRVVCGPYQLHIDCAAVLAVIEDDENSNVDNQSHHRIWRGQTLPVKDGRRHFDLPALDRGVVATEVVMKESSDEGAYILRVDRAMFIEYLEPVAFKPLPRLSDRLTSCFDGIYPDPKNGKLVLRYRNNNNLAEQSCFSW